MTALLVRSGWDEFGVVRKGRGWLPWNNAGGHGMSPGLL